jgi:myo-inositol-1(or 4)-monophosphatase
MSLAADLEDVHAIARELAIEIRTAVFPHLGRSHARSSVGVAPGGDVTMAIDEVAERVIAQRLQAVGDIAYYSEDEGYVRFGRPRATLVIDPIDGTRPAAAGFEACVASIAVLPPDPDATLGQTASGVVVELQSGACVEARRGAGARRDGQALRCHRNPALHEVFWGASQRARPALPVALVLADLIDGCAMHGGYFDLGSAAFTMTRIGTGQLDAYVDPGARMVDELPELEAAFRAVGGGIVATNWPYDIAAAALIVREAGGVVTDASGGALDDAPAIGSGDGYRVSVLAASSAPLHESLLGALEAGFARLRSWSGGAEAS